LAASVSVWHDSGNGLTQVWSASANADGTYATSALLPGTYFVRATAVDCQVYANAACDFVDISGIDTQQATPVLLSGTGQQGGVNFELKTYIFAARFE